MIHLSRSTAVFAVRLLLSVAVVYRFFHAENKSIFAQRYGPCTPPEGTKHTNVRRTGTKYKTIVKDVHYPLVSCGFSTLAPLTEMRYTGIAETNVKEKRSPFRQTLRVCHLPQGGGFSGGGKLSYYIRTSTVGLTACALSVTYGDRFPLLSLRDIFPRSGGSLSSKGEPRALPETLLFTPNALATGFKPWLPLWGSWRGSA